MPLAPAASCLTRPLGAVLDLLLPGSCVACGADRGPVCRPCRQQRWEPGRRDPTPRPPGLPPVWTADEFGGPIRGLLLAYKQHGCWPAMGPLATALADAVLVATAGCRDGPVILVQVPSSARARRRRGHHHVLALCRRAVRDDRLRGVVAVEALLAPTRQVADQRGLRADERRSNLAGSLRCRPVPRNLSGAVCLLVDDVVTTGSTALEATRALEAAGCHVHAVVALAATRRQQIAKNLATVGNRG